MASALAPSAASSAFSNWSMVSNEMALRACGRSMVSTASPWSNSTSTMRRFPSRDIGILLSGE
jgi:threonine/homoserine efflux transporter RhtA